MSYGFGMEARSRAVRPTIRCFWSITLLMNLHIFVTDLVYPVHIFHDAHTVPFCLIADHMATSLCVSSPFQASTVLNCSLHVVNGKGSICSYP